MSDAEAPSTTPAMPDPAITIENLGKRYTIGHQRANVDGLRHAIEARSAIRLPGFGLAGKKSCNMWISGR